MQYIKHQNKSLIHSNSLLIFRLPTEMLMVSHDVKLRANCALMSWYFKSIVCLIKMWGAKRIGLSLCNDVLNHSKFFKMCLPKTFNLHKCETSSGFATFLVLHHHYHQHQFKKQKNNTSTKMPFRVKLQFIPTIILVWISLFIVSCTAQLNCKSVFLHSSETQKFW